MDHLLKEVVRKGTFAVDLRKTACEEGESLSPKVSYSVILEPDRTCVPVFNA